jgi:hypothetical protein
MDVDRSAESRTQVVSSERAESPGAGNDTFLQKAF